MSNTANDEREIAMQYLSEHKIHSLFKRILVLLLLHQPANPKQFITDQLKSDQDLASKPLLNDEEIETLFQMLENPVIDKGFVSGKKINDSLQAMGIPATVKSDEKFNLQQFKSTLINLLHNY
mmetsp:Transcript_66927/g.106423  ORF Transcript_66927/g.106423 Transcript_66927/m.106423 type:complete len:123 (-) Transcript_66927:154-522(-)